jgi:cytochrome c-type biogenesis protein CcmH
MLNTILTAIAGLAVGIVIMRIWQAPNTASVSADAPPAPSSDPGKPANKVPTRGLLIGAGALAVIAAGIMLFRPDTDDTPASALSSPVPVGNGNGQSLDDVDTMMTRLAERLEKNPDGEGYRMLGWSYLMTGRPEKAIEPYKKALTYLPDNATIHSGYAEALTGVAGGTVTNEAKAEFDKAHKLDPAEPRTRYFLALWQAQHGEKKEALEQWITLANSGAADEPWQADVRRKISETSASLGIDVSARLKATSLTQPAAALDPNVMQAASSMSASDRQKMIDGMVEGLAQKLKANPKDADGWVRLLRSRMVLGQKDQAGKDLATARKALAGDASGLSRVNEAAKQLGIPDA